MFGILLMSIVTLYFLICAIKYFKRKESWLGWYTLSAFGFFAMILGLTISEYLKTL